MDDPLNLSMFRAYDIRTPADRLSDALARRLSAAEAAYFREVLDVPAVILACDARRHGPRYAALAAEAYQQAGLDVVWLPGPSTSSYFYYAAMQRPECAGVMIGASHNPAGDTGRKIVGPGAVPIARGVGPEGGLDGIARRHREGAAVAGRRRGRVTAWSPWEAYVRASMELAGVPPGGLKGLRVLHDYLHGAAGREMMLAFQAAGAELTPLHFLPDGRFPLGAPNPVIAEVIRPGLETLRRGDFHLGVFFDGDGDRIDFYHGDGAYLASSFVYAALLPEIRRRFPGPGLGVFADLKSNPRAVIEMARCGVVVDVIRNGHSQIKQAMLEDPARFGAVEESAHFYEAFRAADGRRACAENTLYIALLAARVWREDPERIARMLALQATTAREREWGYKFPSEALRAAALEAVRRRFEAQGAQVLERMKNGMDLEATLMRTGLPLEIDERTPLPSQWLQVCQRVSQSESGLARWEVVGSDRELVRRAKEQIAACVRPFQPGDEYRG